MALIEKILEKLNFSSTKTKIISNLYWAVLGKIVSLLGTLFVGILVARYLGPEQYGLMNYVVSYVSLFQILASFGMDNIEIRELSKQNVDKNILLGTAFYIRLIFSLITVVLVIITALILESDSNTIILISIYSISIIVNRFTVIRNYFTSIMWNEYVVKTEISRILISSIIKIILLFIKAPLWTFVCALTFDFILLSSGYIAVYESKIDSISKWKFDKNTAKYFLKQSYPLLLSGTAVIIYQRIDQVMIGNLINKNSVGLFSVASKFVEILIFIPTIIAQTTTPVLVKLYKDDYDKYYKKSLCFMSLTVWVCFILSLLISISSYWIIFYTFGNKYIESVPILQILSFKTVSVALSSTAGQKIIIEKLQKYTIYRDILGCISCIFLNILFLPIFGVLASAVISIISNIIAGYVSDLLIPKYRHIFKLQTKSILYGWKYLTIKNID